MTVQLGAFLRTTLPLGLDALARLRQRPLEGTMRWHPRRSRRSFSLRCRRRQRALRDHLDAYMRAWNKSPTPFAWMKPADAIIKSHRRMLKRISTAVH